MKCLNDRILEDLNTRDPEAKELWKQTTPIPESQGADQDIHRVNQFLRTQLGLLEAPTIDARECLDDAQTVSQWMTGWRQVVVPVIMEYGLPIWNK